MFASHEDFVRAAYSVLLGRDPEPAGLEYWSQMIDAGLSRRAVVQAVLSSDEYTQLAGSAGDPRRCPDVDVLIPVEGFELRAPAADRSIVPMLLDSRAWEPHVLAYLKAHLQRDHVFMDVGANLGYFTVLCAPLVARVIAFEPVARARAYCVDNVARNGLGNVHVLSVGLWHEALIAGISFDPRILAGGALSVSGDERIVCRALDDLVAEGAIELARLDVVKMDIQGAEVSALAGMRQTIARCRPRIIMEVDRTSLERLGRSVKDVWDAVDELGYRLSAFEKWKDAAPKPVDSLRELESLCPLGSSIDVLTVPG